MGVGCQQTIGARPHGCCAGGVVIRESLLVSTPRLVISSSGWFLLYAVTPPRSGDSRSSIHKEIQLYKTKKFIQQRYPMVVYRVFRWSPQRGPQIRIYTHKNHDKLLKIVYHNNVHDSDDSYNVNTAVPT